MLLLRKIKLLPRKDDDCHKKCDVVSSPRTTTTKSPKDAAKHLLMKLALVLSLLYGVSALAGDRLFSTFVWLASFDEQGNVDRAVNRAFYQILSTVETKGDVTCMNWGYDMSSSHSAPLVLPLDDADEPERYCLQMYHKIGSAVGADLTGMDVLEVGSGRGGGSSYVKRYLHPASMTGLEMASKAVDFSNQHHASHVPGLTFVQGDAEHMPFDENQFDVVINVESSHCYADFPAFLKEVYRVLKPGGRFSWVDFREPQVVPIVNQQFQQAGFTELSSEDVTPNVVNALTKTGQQKMEIIDRRVPRFLRHIFYSFSGVKGTKLYDKLDQRQLIYTHKLLLKK